MERLEEDLSRYCSHLQQTRLPHYRHHDHDYMGIANDDYDDDNDDDDEDDDKRPLKILFPPPADQVA